MPGPGLEHLGSEEPGLTEGPVWKPERGRFPSSLGNWERKALTAGGAAACWWLTPQKRCFSGSSKRQPLLGLPQGDGSLGTPGLGLRKRRWLCQESSVPVSQVPEKWPFPLLLLAPRATGAGDHLGAWWGRLGAAGMLAARVGGPGE